MSWADFIMWLTTSAGVNAIIGFILSFAVEKWPWFQARSKEAKQALFLACSLLIPLVGCVLGILTLGWSASWATTFWPALLAGFTAFASGTMTHAAVTNAQSKRA